MITLMAEQNTPARPTCERCHRPRSHCLCPYVAPVDHRTRVLILQHPDESGHPLNTARLAVLGLSNADIRVGIHFPELEAVLAENGPGVLLFPSGDDDTTGSETAVRDVPRQPDLLIVPDGTWRKARGIVRANPVLNTLPRLDLPATQRSRYRIRKAREAGALSTIEAVVRALTIMEPGVDFQPVLQPFEKLIEQQIEAMGPDVYRRHYSND